jgi:toxin YoeB
VKNIVFDPKAFKQFNEWAIEDKKLYKKIVDLIDDILRHPFSGIGKPEPLKHQLKGYWSRRINDEHRLVYKITETEIIIKYLNKINYPFLRKATIAVFLFCCPFRSSGVPSHH